MDKRLSNAHVIKTAGSEFQVQLGSSQILLLCSLNFLYHIAEGLPKIACCLPLQQDFQNIDDSEGCVHSIQYPSPGMALVIGIRSQKAHVDENDRKNAPAEGLTLHEVKAGCLLHMIQEIAFKLVRVHQV